MNPWIARNLVYRPATWIRGEPVFSLLRRYERSQWWPTERHRAAQEEHLDGLLRHAAARSPHYRTLVRDAGIDPERIGAGDLPRLPVLTKADLVQHAPALQIPRPPGTTSWKTTGGSTGGPVRIPKSRRATATEQAASWRSYGWYGIRPGDPQARFWGVALERRARLRFRAIDRVLNRVRFSAFAFRPEDLSHYYAELARARPAWAYGYVSMLSEFAAFCLEERLPLADLGIRAVVTTSEVLGAADRERIARAFGAPVFNEYGCGEVGAILYECERGRLHAMMENLLLELEPDPTPDEPRAHRVLVTDLHNLAFPLVRYDVGDRVVPAPGCECGRGLEAFERVFGRAYDMIESPEGRRFHGEFFLYILEAARDRSLPVRQAQFVQTAPDRVEVRIVPLGTYRDDVGSFFCEEIERRTDGALRASAVGVEEIAREPSGKIRLVKALSGGVLRPGGAASA
jgi:phenylacetate-CoA ligase